MNKYNFETRELCPYRDDWNRGGNIVICGALWYIKEEDGMFLLDTEETRKGTYNRPYNRYRVAQGLPAALLAQGIMLSNPNFNYIACAQAYFKETQSLFPNRLPYYFLTVLEDWKLSLMKMAIIQHDESGYLSRFAQMRVAVLLREASNPYAIHDVVDQLNRKYYYTCQIPNRKETQLVFSDMPSIEERTEAPMIYACDLDKDMNTSKIQADGFIAAIINLAIYYYWKKRWSEYDFTNLDVIESIIQAYKRTFPIIEISELDKLSFDLPIEVEEICRAYMTAFEPIMRKVWKMKPEIQMECIEEDNIYTYIYAHEVSSLDRLYASELYANLNSKQQRTLVSYERRFWEWMCKTYSITTLKQHRVMQAMTKDMPPIQLTIKNTTKITRAGEPKKNAGKFKYIISDDKKIIMKIHKRIEKHLDSPAGLRDELLQLQQEGLVALPLRSSTAIFREVERLWGELTFKEHTFVTTWGRIKK